MLVDAESNGHERGLHTNYVEFSKILNLNKNKILNNEINILKKFFDVKGIAPHRDLNYCYNSLPDIELNWDSIKSDNQIEYHAYDSKILNNTVYINEGFNPHLCWRLHKPEEIIPTGDSIYLLTHNHWWYDDYPFED